MLSEGSLRDGEDKDPPLEEDSGDSDTLQGYQWLLRDLPRLPLFDSVKTSTALALQQVGAPGGGAGGGSGDPALTLAHGPPAPQAIHMETDPQTISAYLVYLSQHTPAEEQGQHSDLALVRAQATPELPVQSRVEGAGGGRQGLTRLAVCYQGFLSARCWEVPRARTPVFSPVLLFLGRRPALAVRALGSVGGMSGGNGNGQRTGPWAFPSLGAWARVQPGPHHCCRFQLNAVSGCLHTALPCGSGELPARVRPAPTGEPMPSCSSPACAPPGPWPPARAGQHTVSSFC